MDSAKRNPAFQRAMACSQVAAWATLVFAAQCPTADPGGGAGRDGDGPGTDIVVDGVTPPGSASRRPPSEAPTRPSSPAEDLSENRAGKDATHDDAAAASTPPASKESSDLCRACSALYRTISMACHPDRTRDPDRRTIFTAAADLRVHDPSEQVCALIALALSASVDPGLAAMREPVFQAVREEVYAQALRLDGLKGGV